MRATELRIGNLIQEGEITMLSNSNVWIGNDIFLTDEIEPIPITEEWLLKFGFEKCNFNIPDKYKKQDCGFSIKFRNEKEFTVEYKYGHVSLKHVHQLQNLYFALTNKEL